MSVYKSTIYNGKHARFFIRCCFTCELRVTANIHLSDAKFNGVKYEEEIIARIQNTRTQLRPGCNETHTHTNSPGNNNNNVMDRERGRERES